MPRLRAFMLLGIWFGLVALLGPFLITTAWLTGKENFLYKTLRMCVKLGLAAVAVRVIVTGLDRLNEKETYVFTPNHQSLLEVPLLVTFLNRNIAYLAKKELFRYPIFGQGMRVIGVIPVDRRNTQSAIESARRATTNLRRGKSYVVYPEGTRSPDGRLLPFKKGAFVMAVEAGVPIVPVTISGSAAIMPKQQLKVYPSTVRITVHQPISTQGHTRESVGELMALARAAIQSSLDGEGDGEGRDC